MPTMCGMRHKVLASGWTLIELMIVVAIGAVMLAMAVPQYRDWIATYQLANAAQQLAGSMTLARSEAMKRGSRVNLCRSADGRRCSDAAGWESGWLVFADVDRDGQLGDDEPLLRLESAA